MSFLDTVKRNKYYHNLEYSHEQEGEICLVACGMERCDPGATYGPELRDCYHLHVILSGTGVLKVRGKEFHPRCGQLFILKDSEVVEYSADLDNPWEYCWVTYMGTEAEKITDDLGFKEGIYCLDSAVDATEFYKMILRMHQNPEMNYSNDLRRKGILLEFLALALEATDHNRRTVGCKREYDSKAYVEKAIEFIRYNYATITVADIVRFVGFSRAYFTTLFKKETGISLQEYLLQYRVKEAKELLIGTNQPVNVIAEKVGYEDQLTFSRAFRRHVGMSPMKYRMEKTERKEENPVISVDLAKRDYDI